VKVKRRGGVGSGASGADATDSGEQIKQ